MKLGEAARAAWDQPDGVRVNAAMSTRVAAIVRSARAREKRCGASAIAPILNRIGHLPFDDLARDSVFADARPLPRAVARKDVDRGVDEL